MINRIRKTSKEIIRSRQFLQKRNLDGSHKGMIRSLSRLHHGTFREAVKTVPGMDHKKFSRGNSELLASLINKHFVHPSRNKMIVGRSISEDLLLASSLVSNVKLFEYELYVTVKEIQQ